MQLNFVQTIDMTSRADVCQVGHEHNNDLVEYYMRDSRLLNKSCEPPLGQYTFVAFEEESNRVPVGDFVRYGIKSFPKIGAYGWFKCKYENVTKMLVPINAQRQRYPAPTLILTSHSDYIQCDIVTPSGVTYECYRIIMRQGYEANEYITYDTAIDIPKPYPDANYTIYCVAYKADGQISEDSTHQILAIAGGINPRPEPEVPYNIQSQLDAKFDGVELEETNKLRFYGNSILLDEVTIPLGATRYVHDQAVAAMVWTIEHNLGYFPNVFILTSAGDQVYGQIEYTDTNTVVTSFNAPFTGKVYLS